MSITFERRVDLAAEWADALSERVSRPAKEIRAKGLGAGDFRPEQFVELAWPDGSHALFRYAFFLADEKRGEVAIFTEHCGYWVVPYGAVEVQFKIDVSVMGS